MPTLALAGLPYALYQRVKRRPLSISGWDLVVFPSGDAKLAALNAPLVRQVMQRCLSDNGGGHVLAFSKETNRNNWAADFRPHLRFRWLDNGYLGYLPDQVDEFLQFLQEEADFELAWRQQIRPAAVDSPLLLPECSFRPRTYPGIWAEAAGVAPVGAPGPIDREIRKVARQLSSFTDGHRREAAWFDARDLVFSTGPYHGLPPEEIWKWKYSWRIPDGFHFDVRHHRGNAFSLRDFAADTHRIVANGYINVDCHGRCRRGS